MRRALPLLLGLAASGCDMGFRPETLVEDLRLLGVRSTPADLAPGETAQLEALAVDPSRPGKRSTVLWLGCDPDPFNLNRSACSDFAVLADAGALFAPSPDGGVAPDGVRVIGFGPRASFAASPTVFASLPPDDERRRAGTVGQALLFAVAEDVPPTAGEAELRALFERVQRQELKSVIALFRVRISESPERNRNPTAAPLLVGRERWPRGARVTVLPGEKVELDVAAPDEDFERFTNATPSGVEEKTERVLAAWYATAGRFSEERTALREQVRTVFTAPGGADLQDPVPASREGTLYVVLRDTRGGQAWIEAPFFVCDPARPAPVVTQVRWPSSPSEPVVLAGRALEQVLDVVVDGAALEDGAFSPTSGTWSGFLPAGVAVGAARGSLHTRACDRAPLPTP